MSDGTSNFDFEIVRTVCLYLGYRFTDVSVWNNGL